MPENTYKFHADHQIYMHMYVVRCYKVVILLLQIFTDVTEPEESIKQKLCRNMEWSKKQKISMCACDNHTFTHM